MLVIQWKFMVIFCDSLIFAWNNRRFDENFSGVDTFLAIRSCFFFRIESESVFSAKKDDYS